MPTPNGRLHLGHIAGPFLRADVLARHLRRRGGRVRVISGFDSFESYMTLQAVREACSPAEVAGRYGAGILRDLRALDIAVDAWIDPLAPEWAERFGEAHRDLMRAILASGRAATIRESVGYFAEADRHALGCWLLCRCPECGEAASGFSCEACGANFQPWQAIDPSPRPPIPGPMADQELLTPFLTIRDDPEINAWFDRVTMDEAVCSRLRRAFSARDHHIRLVAPGSWGVAWPIQTPDDREVGGVLFSYTFNAAYCLLIGEVWREQNQEPLHPFDIRSDARVSAFCGMDVALSKCLNVPASLLAKGGLRPFDRVSVNAFYNLAGEKFSTSRRHAVWAEEIVTRTPATSDSIRLHLAATAPGRTATNFDPGEYVAAANQLAERVARHVLSAVARLAGPAPHGPSTARRTRLDEALDRQARALDGEPIDLPAVARSILAWMEAGPDDDDGDRHWWLKGLSVLAWPVMPALASELWMALGCDGEPSIVGWDRATTPSATATLTPLPFVTIQEFDPCLPATIRTMDDARSGLPGS